MIAAAPAAAREGGEAARGACVADADGGSVGRGCSSTSGCGSPGSAPASPSRKGASPPASQYRNFASPNENLGCSPGVDSRGSWHAGNESLRPNDVINKSSDTTAAEDVFGPGCFSCFACFGRTQQLDRSRVLETSTSSPGSAHTSASRLRLGIVIVHFDDVKDLAKKSHVSCAHAHILV